VVLTCKLTVISEEIDDVELAVDESNIDELIVEEADVDELIVDTTKDVCIMS